MWILLEMSVNWSNLFSLFFCLSLGSSVSHSISFSLKTWRFFGVMYSLEYGWRTGGTLHRSVTQATPRTRDGVACCAVDRWCWQRRCSGGIWVRHHNTLSVFCSSTLFCCSVATLTFKRSLYASCFFSFLFLALVMSLSCVFCVKNWNI